MEAVKCHTYFEVGDPSLVKNYCLISLLSLVSKVLEHIVHQRVSNYMYLRTHHSLSHHQFGFRAGSSTQEALLSITNDWHLRLSSNRGPFLDHSSLPFLWTRSVIYLCHIIVN